MPGYDCRYQRGSAGAMWKSPRCDIILRSRLRQESYLVADKIWEMNAYDMALSTRWMMGGGDESHNAAASRFGSCSRILVRGLRSMALDGTDPCAASAPVQGSMIN
jgi:hypothetical protein